MIPRLKVLVAMVFLARTQVTVDAQGNAVQTTASEERAFAPSDLLGLYSDLPEGVGTPGNPAPPTMTADLQAKFRDGLAQETRYRTDVGASRVCSWLKSLSGNHGSLV